MNDLPCATCGLPEGAHAASQGREPDSDECSRYVALMPGQESLLAEDEDAYR